jgi:hypothetical protein
MSMVDLEGHSLRLTLAAVRVSESEAWRGYQTDSVTGTCVIRKAHIWLLCGKRAEWGRRPNDSTIVSILDLSVPPALTHHLATAKVSESGIPHSLPSGHVPRLTSSSLGDQGID